MATIDKSGSILEITKEKMSLKEWNYCKEEKAETLGLSNKHKLKRDGGKETRANKIMKQLTEG